MGGHSGGEIASRLAVDILSEHCARSATRLRAGAGRKLASLRAMVKDLVLEWTQHANAEIYAKCPEGTDARARMGTTLALILLVEDFIVIAHVGDSRVYRLRAGQIEKLTEDHSIVGPAPPKVWGQPPRKRKFVTKALGTKPTVEPDIRLEDARAGDLYLLCSDGLYDLVKEKEIVKILAKAGADRRTGLRSLVHLANKRGGRDNITVVLAEVQDESMLAESEDTESIARPRQPAERQRGAVKSGSDDESQASGSQVGGA
jgi:protein phosphatase